MQQIFYCQSTHVGTVVHDPMALQSLKSGMGCEAGKSADINKYFTRGKCYERIKWRAEAC